MNKLHSKWELVSYTKLLEENDENPIGLNTNLVTNSEIDQVVTSPNKNTEKTPPSVIMVGPVQIPVSMIEAVAEPYAE